jgi:hypothetical protein
VNPKRLPARPKWSGRDETYFLNVDLDVFARSSLEPLAVAFGSKVVPLYVGRHGNRYRAHFELAWEPRSADARIAGLVQLVKSLPSAARVVWNQAYRRDFNIGIQGGFAPRSYELALKPGTLKLAGNVNARVVVTIYAADMPAMLAQDDHRRQPAPPNRPLQPTSGSRRRASLIRK